MSVFPTQDDTPFVAEVVALRRQGVALETIAARMGMGRDRVERILSETEPHAARSSVDPVQVRIVTGTTRLLAAIRRHHPERCTEAGKELAA